MLGSLRSLLRAKEPRPREIAVALGIAFLFAAAFTSVHFLVRIAEGEPTRFPSIANMVVEIILLSTPVIYFARGTIAALMRSRAEMKDLSRRLAIAVEEAEEASRAKSRFLANMSHELRTPLNAILGFSEMMKDQHLGPVHNPRYLAYARDIHDSGRHLLGIINDVLDLSKIEAGKMSLDSAEEFALAASVDATLAMVTGLGEKYGVTVSNHLPDDKVRLIAVERMIRQIVLNLVGNAIKFTPEGGKVQIEGGLLPDGGYLLLVRDTGMGMSEKEIANALVPFGQNASKLTAKHDGTGLGLPLAKAMLELHGGTLSISSWPDQGTVVSLAFPPCRVVAGERVAA